MFWVNRVDVNNTLISIKETTNNCIKRGEERRAVQFRDYPYKQEEKLSGETENTGCKHASLFF